MKKKDIKRIVDEAWRIVDDRLTSKALRLEALRILAACNGVWIGDVDERLLAPKLAFELRQVRQTLVARALGHKAARTRQNQRNYLRRKIRTLEALTAQTMEGMTEGDVQDGNESIEA